MFTVTVFDKTNNLLAQAEFSCEKSLITWIETNYPDQSEYTIKIDKRE